MKQLTAQQKHSILTHYSSRRAGDTLASILSQHGAAVGRSTFYSWMEKWDGTPQSLEHKPMSGRPRVLSSQQVTRHVRPRILAPNRRAAPVHYSSLLPAVQAATDTQISARTLRRYGMEELGAKQKRGKKRTADECECTHTCAVRLAALLHEYDS